MESNYSMPGNGEDGLGIPDDLRCKRSDGKQWRCTAMSMPDKTVCEKHYVQAKKRAANSALRASMKRGKRSKVGDDGEFYADNRNDDIDTQTEDETFEEYTLSHPNNFKGEMPNGEFSYSPGSSSGRSFRESSREYNDAEFSKSPDNQRSSYGDLPAVAMDNFMSKPVINDSDEMEEYSDASTDSSDESEEQPCHQCQRNDKILWCLRCDRRGYCGNCISSWYMDIPLEEIQKACPACRGLCVCSSCKSTERLIKTRIRKVPVQKKMEYLYCLLSSVLPILKKIHHQQTFEVDLEKRLHGIDVNPSRAKLSADEQMCCNYCRTPIIDYYRHCENCEYDLCLNCCQDLREASTARGQDRESMGLPSIKTNIFRKLNKWKVNRDGSIPCPQKECVGCSSLVLCRTFKMNWVAKLVKNAGEIVSGCKVTDVDYNLDNSEGFDLPFFKAAASEYFDNNLLCSPTSDDMKTMAINLFRKYLLKGQPVILKQVCNNSISSWDHGNICRSILEMTNENNDESMKVKAIDCLDASKVEIDVDQFIKGYSEEIVRENGMPQVLKWIVSMAPSIFEEFLSHQDPEIISRLPFLEYIHPKWGLMNIAAKLPPYSLQSDVGFRILISYGAYDKLGECDSVSKLNFSMNDKVFILVHTKVKQKAPIKETCDAEKHSKASQTTSFIAECPPAFLQDGQPKNSLMDANVEDNKEVTLGEHQMKTCPSNDASYNREIPSNCNRDLEKTDAGAVWDIFRRQDVPKLLEFLKINFKVAEEDDDVNPLYDEAVYLNEHCKALLKEQYGVEPWSFEQQIGQAVFVPAGCPFQVNNILSTVQLSLDFLSPESLQEAAKMSDEIRCLPDDHDAKLKMLEVGKMSLYAASSAIKEIQKLVLDPRFSSDIGPEDLNLTKMVAQNLEKMTRHRQPVPLA